MVHMRLRGTCSGKYIGELEHIVSSIDEKTISIQPCISDEGYMIRYPPIGGVGEPDFNILCKLIRTLNIGRTICSPMLKVGRIDDGDVALTFTHDGGLTIQRIRKLENAAIYALRGYRIILLTSKCRLCDFRVFECMIGLCGICLEKLEFNYEQDVLSENICVLLSNIARIDEGGGIEAYLEEQLGKLSRIIWLSHSIDEVNTITLYMSIILSMANLYSRIRNARELKKITDHLCMICYSDRIERILENIIKLYRDELKLK